MAQFPTFVDGLPLTRRALEFAAERHEGQRREADDAAFILHPLEVAQLLRAGGYPDEIVAAGVLHDSLENTDATPLELEQRFGSRGRGAGVRGLGAVARRPLRRAQGAAARLGRATPTTTSPSSTPPTRSPRRASCG